MAEDNLFQKLTRLFRSGPTVRRKIRAVSGPKSPSSVDLFQQVRSDIYNSVLSAYGSFDRMARYSDFAEMEATPELASALDIYAEETVSQDERGISLHIYSDERKVKELLETLFYDTLNIGFNLVMWVRNMCKYGDLYLLLDVSDEYGVVGAYPIPIAEVEREEGYDPENPTAFRFRWLTRGNSILENWQVAHFRLLGNDAFLPYGTSVLESARRIWRQLILMEDAMLVYRVIRSPERRVFYIDVGNVPPEEISNYMEQAKDSLKRQPIVDKTDGRVDLRYNPYPVWSESVIPLLDGRHITIRELALEFEAGNENWVYSVQDDTSQIVPGKVVWCGKNYEAKRLTRVWLDDNTWVVTAPEHPFLMRDGSSKRADELVEGESLMPLYRNVNVKGYERCYVPRTGKWESTHKLVAMDTHRDEWNNESRPVVHHKQPWLGETNKRNNEPNNLQVMDFWQHRQWHVNEIQHTLLRPDVREANGKRRAEMNRSDDHRRLVAEANVKYDKARKMGLEYNGTEFHASHNEARRSAQIKSWSENSETRKSAMRWVIPNEVYEAISNIVKESPSIGREATTQLLRNNPDVMTAIANANESNNRDSSKFHVAAVLSAFKREGNEGGWSDFKSSFVGEHKNHKVIRVETIEYDADVYCMTVVGPNGEEDRHNFAMCSFEEDSDLLSPRAGYNGLFVMNSVDEDYFIPVRGGETGTKIETLAGGSNTTAIEDVEYIQKKLFAAIKIPKAYLGYDEEIGSKATLAQEDIRFSRTIQHIQRTVISELNKIAMIHLYAAGFRGEDLINFDLQLSNPSSIAQQQKLELISSKFDIAAKAPEGVVDREWVRRNVMGLTKAEIEKIADGRRRDKQEDSDVEASGASEGGEEVGGGEDLFAADIPTGGELLGAGPRGSLGLALDDDDSPIKAEKKIKSVFGDEIEVKPKRRRKGRGSHEMPNFSTMVGTGRTARTQDTSNDPYDLDGIDPTWEGTRLSPRLGAVSQFVGSKSQQAGVLTEQMDSMFSRAKVLDELDDDGDLLGDENDT